MICYPTAALYIVSNITMPCEPQYFFEYLSNLYYEFINCQITSNTIFCG